MTLALEPDAAGRFAAEMRAAGFNLRVPDPDFVRRTRVMPFAHEATGMPLDVVLAGSGLEDEFLARAQSVQVGSVVLSVIEVSDLIIAKVLAGRPKDIDDARALCTTRSDSVDESRIREILRSLEEALAQSDLVSTFDRLRSGSR